MVQKEALVTVVRSDIKRGDVNGCLQAFERLGATGIRAEQQEGDPHENWSVQGKLVGVPEAMELDVSNL